MNKISSIKKWVLALLLTAPTLMSAQVNSPGFLVKGQVIDSLTSETIPYVTCSIAPESSPQQVSARFASDENGKFSNPVKSAGKYVLVITYIGKQSVAKHFQVSTSEKLADLGKILLADSKESLKEVNIVGSKPLIKADADKISYDAQQDPESKSSTVLDLLRKVPMVTVDGQDNVQLKGSSNFKFFLNGKPTNMFNANPGAILKSLPASMVKNIEVITRPGAKYDAEGIGGIINIVTVQQASSEGYSATLNAQADSKGSYGGGINLILQKGKFSFSGNYNYNYYKQFPITTTSERHSYVLNTPYPLARQVADVKTNTPMQFASGQMSYELDSLNLFTFSFDRSYGRPKSITDALTEDFSDEAGLKKVFEYSQNGNQHQTWGSTGLGLDYQRSFKKKEETLTFSYKLNNTPNNSDFEGTNVINKNYITTPQVGLTQWSDSKNKASTNEHTFQLDYSDPIGKGNTIEFGAKYILRMNDSKSEESYKYFDFSQNYPFTPYVAADTATNFKNNLDILGLYTNYAGGKRKWSWNGGVRYEYTWLDAKFHVPAMNFKTDYGVFVPSANLSYKISPMESYRLSYNMRIQRPSISYLNPYIDKHDPNYVSYGNPNLNPEKSHNISLGYSKFAQVFSINADLTYTFVNNSIQSYSFIQDGSTVQEMTYGNIGHDKQLSLNLFASYRPNAMFNFYTNSSVGYKKIKSGSYNMSNDGFTGRYFIGGTANLPKDVKVSGGGGGNLSEVLLQGKQSSFYFTYLALSKDFFNKRLNVSVSGVYLPKTHLNIETTASNFTQNTDVHLTQSTQFRLNISYRIGDITAKVKKAKATIENDDQKTKSNSSVGQAPM